MGNIFHLPALLANRIRSGANREKPSAISFQKTTAIIQSAKISVQETIVVIQGTNIWVREAPVLAEEAGNLAEEIKNSVKETPDLVEETGNLVEETKNPVKATRNLAEKTENSVKATRNSGKKMPELTENFADLSEETGNLTEKTANWTREIVSLVLGTLNLVQETAALAERFSNLSENFAELAEETENSSGETLSPARGKLVIYGGAVLTVAPLLPLSRMIRLISGYSGYSTDDLSHLGETVAANLPGLGIFSTLKPTPAEITAAVTALQQAVMMKGPGRAQAIEAAFNALADLLGDVADNAPQIANVTDTELAAIGLPVAKTPTRVTSAPAACENLRLSHGTQPGEVTGRCEPANGNIRVYEGQWTLDPNGSNGNGWSDPETFPNSRGFKFSGLTRGKDVWVRVRARNTVGAGAWSDPATVMVT